jgi:hypothetical protein
MTGPEAACSRERPYLACLGDVRRGTVQVVNYSYSMNPVAVELSLDRASEGESKRKVETLRGRQRRGAVESLSLSTTLSFVGVTCNITPTIQFTTRQGPVPILFCDRERDQVKGQVMPSVCVSMSMSMRPGPAADTDRA